MKFYKRIEALTINDEIVPVALEENESGEIEVGSPTAALLQIALVGEYQQWDLYTAYASRLGGLTRDAIADHFKEHANDELSHIELLQRYLVSMGENPTLQRKDLPEIEDASIKDIVVLQLKFENDAVNLYKKILTILPDNEPLKLDIEGIITKEQEHVHDLELLLKDTIVATFIPTEHGEPTRPQGGYGACDDVIDRQWCAKALKELTPDIYARWNQGKLLTAQEKNFVAHAIAMRWGLKDKRALLRLLGA